MTRKELQKLNRAQLLDMLMHQTRRTESLERENDRLKARLAEREQHLSQMGTMAEAILQMGGKLTELQRENTEKYLGVVRESSAADFEAEQKQEEEEKQEEDAAAEGEDPPDLPTAEQLEWALNRERYRQRYMWSLKTTVYALVTVSAVAVLIAVLLMPVLQIYGMSMNPTLYEGDFVVTVKGGKMETGDLIAFYYNNKVLVKRVIAQPGQWVDIAEDGTVYVDNVAIDEPYLPEKAFGECDIALPYQVPESRTFVMGDNRSVSVDSRSTTIGCVAEEQLVGRIVFRIWPLSEFGKL